MDLKLDDALSGETRTNQVYRGPASSRESEARTGQSLPPHESWALPAGRDGLRAVRTRVSAHPPTGQNGPFTPGKLPKSSKVRKPRFSAAAVGRQGVGSRMPNVGLIVHNEQLNRSQRRRTELRPSFCRPSFLPRYSSSCRESTSSSRLYLLSRSSIRTLRRFWTSCRRRHG